ncbi:MAG: UpxY family transcription antiterminator [Bacteroidota bacterium]
MESPINQLHPEEARWFAIRTKFKHEKQAAKWLISNEVEVYLPLQKLVRRYTRKVKTVELPLISGYLFVKITKAEYLTVLKTSGVVGFIRIAKQLIAIPEAEIKLMQRVVGETDGSAEVSPISLANGDAVEIIGGQLTGVRGKLLDCSNDKNFLVELTHIGFELRMQIPSELLRRCAKSFA